MAAQVNPFRGWGPGPDQPGEHGFESNEKKLVYICSPLRGDIEGNIKKAMRYCEYAAGCGVIPISTPLCWSGIFDDTIPEKREMALKLGLELIERMDEIWVCGDRISEGMAGEIDFAQKINRPVLYISDQVVRNDMRVRQNKPPLTLEDVVDGSQNLDYANRVLVANPEALEKGQRFSDNSLWVATHGPGCAGPEKAGSAIHVVSLFSRERKTCDREDFLGMVKPESLLNWLENHPAQLDSAGIIEDHLKGLDTGFELAQWARGDEEAEI